VVACDDDPEGGWSMCRALRRLERPVRRVLVLVTGAQIADLEVRDNLFEDFQLTPFHPRELEARLRHLFYNELVVPSSSIVEHAGLRLNLETYQATFGGRPLDLTYMEYELLKFFVQNPGRVYSREVILAEVWGYEYFGGARTVDVHVRRLRAKLGEEHAHLIETVRSVGYRFGASKWAG
jgi:DNA-binding response OmpR family regulator